MNGDLFQQEGYDLMAAAFEVHREKGSGFLEDVYQECLEKEFALRNIPFQSKPRLRIYYKGDLLRQYYDPDFLVFSEIIVELKAVKALGPDHEAQLMNYLRATRKRIGYLINFGGFPRLEWKRFVIDLPPNISAH